MTRRQFLRVCVVVAAAAVLLDGEPPITGGKERG